MKTLGLIAGRGDLPFEVAREAREKGVERIVAVGFPGQTNESLGGSVDELHWVQVGQLGRLIKTLRGAGAVEAVMVGRLDPSLVVRELKLDMRMIALAARVRDRRPETVLRAIAGEMEKDGIRLLDSTTYLTSCMVPRGLVAGREPGKAVRRDIEFGREIAREVARLDIGQTVVVKRGAVVAVEAMEGTDETVRRAAGLCGPGMVVVKVSRPEQDMRFDVPVVGEKTMDLLAAHGASALAIEAGRTILLDREAVEKKAREKKIAVVGI